MIAVASLARTTTFATSTPTNAAIFEASAPGGRPRIRKRATASGPAAAAAPAAAAPEGSFLERFASFSSFDFFAFFSFFSFFGEPSPSLRLLPHRARDACAARSGWGTRGELSETR